MNKKSKIILSLVIILFIVILALIGYTPSDRDNENNKISTIDIQIDDSKLNIFYFM